MLFRGPSLDGRISFEGSHLVFALGFLHLTSQQRFLCRFSRCSYEFLNHNHLRKVKNYLWKVVCRRVFLNLGMRFLLQCFSVLFPHLSPTFYNIVLICPKGPDFAFYSLTANLLI